VLPPTDPPAKSDATLERQLARLRWQCRRGMLELDTLLFTFLDKLSDQITAQQLGAFEKLLTSSDQVLLEILMGRATPHDKDVADVAEQVRLAAGP